MTQQSKNGQFWLLRRNDQAVVAAVFSICLTVWFAWWTFQGGWRGTFTQLDRAKPRTYSFKVDVNRADWPELAQLPRIGEVTARKIAASRKSKGPFDSIEDLKRVRGIGPKTVERMRPYLLPIEKQQ